MIQRETNRLLLQFEQLLREVNREVINSEIEDLSLDKLRPFIHMVAKCRGAYLKSLFDLSVVHSTTKTLPSEEEMAELKVLRERFLDLADGAKSIEISIQRGYLDLK
tara:strand:+ start:3845 stop:4165 length:321 start_codon:yes stop_codon:yes gene_type:complete